MIVVVEGPSAVGKSSWVATHGTDNVIAEAGRIEVPDGLAGARLATFWGEANFRRWAEAVKVETRHGLALCDTDPLKLHYTYCLARVGVAPWSDFEFGITKASDAIRQQRLGLADIVLVSIPSDETLVRKRDSDPLRRRRNFDLHRQLGPSLSEWYSTLDQLDPGRVRWESLRQCLLQSLGSATTSICSEPGWTCFREAPAAHNTDRISRRESLAIVRARPPARECAVTAAS